MDKVDKAWARLAMAIDQDKKDKGKRYRGDFKSRSGLSTREFYQRKSAGRYSYK